MAGMKKDKYPPRKNLTYDGMVMRSKTERGGSGKPIKVTTPKRSDAIRQAGIAGAKSVAGKRAAGAGGKSVKNIATNVATSIAGREMSKKRLPQETTRKTRLQMQKGFVADSKQRNAAKAMSAKTRGMK